MTGARVGAECVQAGNRRARLLERFAWATEHDLHEGDVGRRIQRGELGVPITADRDLSLRTGECLFDPALSGEPEAPGELQLGSLAGGPLGALEARGFLDLRLHLG